MNKTLLAVAVALAYSVTPAWAKDEKPAPSLDITVGVHNVTVDLGDKSALVSNGSGNSAATSNGTVNNNFTDSFNTSTIAAATTLNGTVSDNVVKNIGNSGYNSGDVNGGDAGDGGDAKGGDPKHGGGGDNERRRHHSSGGAGGPGGAGGAGGTGGTIKVGTGNFDMSNKMTSVGQGAAGIIVAAQNSGANSLIQQATTVQANLNIGGGSASLNK